MSIAEEISGILDDVAGELPTASAAVSRGSVIASKALRMAINESGNISLGGIDCDVRTAIWVMAAEFSPRVRVGDVLIVDAIPAFVVSAMLSTANLIIRAQIVLCEDSVTVGDTTIPCHIGLLAQDVETSLGGFLPDDVQGFFVPESIIPEVIGDDGEPHQVEIVATTQVQVSGETFTVEKVSRDARHGVLCVTCRRRGDV